MVKLKFLWAVALASAACSSPKPPPPNFVFIMADDHAAHAISAYGSQINHTPHIDRLAAEGMRFDNCFCTNSICAPSRAVILTGKYSHLNGMVENRGRFNGHQQTFPKLFQQAGYQTALIGKWHLKSTPTGFDYHHVLPGQGDYHNPEMLKMGQSQKHQGYSTDIITDFSLDWLENKRDNNKPFFLMLHTKAPHRPWNPSQRHRNLYKDHDIVQPKTFDDDYQSRSLAARQTEMTIAEHFKENDVKGIPPADLNDKERKNWFYQRYIKDYLRCVAAIDDNVGRVLDYLKEQGLEQNTVVVYTSDQGFFLGDHGWYDKRFMYEESLRMPLLVRYPPLIHPGSINKDMVLNLDFANTFLDLAGIEQPDDLQGESFEALLAGQTPEQWRRSMYYHFYEYPGVHMVKRHYGVRTDRYKLIRFYHDIDAWELYDLEQDPDELNNLYGQPSYADIQKELKDELARLQEHYGESAKDAEKRAAEFMKRRKKWLERQNKPS